MEETNLLELAKQNGWNYISQHQKLSEDFIVKFQDKLDWYWVSKYQKLSEDFMYKFQNRFNWYLIYKYQKLSETFIDKFQNKLPWYWISKYKKLSENFIANFQNRVDWKRVSTYQKLSEDFITQFQDRVNWLRISKFQKLSEDFIAKYQDRVDWSWVSRYQKLSEEFMTQYNIEKPENSWLYATTLEKLTYLKQIDVYPIINNTYIEAYKSVKSDYFSVFNFQYQYEVGKTYETHCDHRLDEDNSFGLSAWTKPLALEYHSDGKLLKIRIDIEDIGAIIKNSNKIRCSRLTVLEEILL